MERRLHNFMVFSIALVMFGGIGMFLGDFSQNLPNNNCQVLNDPNAEKNTKIQPADSAYLGDLVFNDTFNEDVVDTCPTDYVCSSGIIEGRANVRDSGVFPSKYLEIYSNMEAGYASRPIYGEYHSGLITFRARQLNSAENKNAYIKLVDLYGNTVINLNMFTNSTECVVKWGGVVYGQYLPGDVLKFDLEFGSGLFNVSVNDSQILFNKPYSDEYQLWRLDFEVPFTGFDPTYFDDIVGWKDSVYYNWDFEADTIGDHPSTWQVGDDPAQNVKVSVQQSEINSKKVLLVDDKNNEEAGTAYFNLEDNLQSGVLDFSVLWRDYAKVGTSATYINLCDQLNNPIISIRIALWKYNYQSTAYGRIYVNGEAISGSYSTGSQWTFRATFINQDVHLEQVIFATDKGHYAYSGEPISKIVVESTETNDFGPIEFDYLRIQGRKTAFSQEFAPEITYASENPSTANSSTSLQVEIAENTYKLNETKMILNENHILNESNYDLEFLRHSWLFDINMSTNLLQLGKNQLGIWVNDTHNLNSGWNNVSLFYDPTPPLIQILSPSEYDLTETPIDLEIYITETNLDSSWLMIDANGTEFPVTNGTLGFSLWNSLAEGNHTITVWANDTVGNSHQQSIDFGKDTQEPLISINSPGNSTWWSVRPEIEIVYYDANLLRTWLQVNLNPTQFEVLNGTFSDPIWEIMEEGENKLNYYIEDAFGRIAIESLIIFKDTQQPQIMVTTWDNSTWWDACPNLNFTFYDVNLFQSGIQIENEEKGYVDMILLGNGTITEEIWISLPEGENHLTFFVEDLDGNHQNETIIMQKDTIFPALQIFGIKDHEWMKSSPEITVEIHEINLNQSWIFINDNLTQWEVENGTLNTEMWDLFKEGENTLTVHCNDLFGHKSAITLTIYKDTNEPIIVSFSPVSGLNCCIPFELEMEVFDITNVSVFVNIWNDTYPIPFANGTISHEIWTIMEEGTNSLEFHFVDDLGQESIQSVTIFKDSKAPTIVTSEFDENVWYLRAPDLTLDIQDLSPFSSYMVLNSQQNISNFEYVNPLVLIWDSLPFGTNNISFIAMDALHQITQVELSVKKAIHQPEYVNSLFDNENLYLAIDWEMGVEVDYYAIFRSIEELVDFSLENAYALVDLPVFTETLTYEEDQYYYYILGVINTSFEIILSKPSSAILIEIPEPTEPDPDTPDDTTEDPTDDTTEDPTDDPTDDTTVETPIDDISDSPSKISGYPLFYVLGGFFVSLFIIGGSGAIKTKNMKK